MQNPSQQQQGGGQVAWWFKFLARGVGTLGGIVAIITGLVACITLHANCLIAGIIQMLIGFLAALFEAPCCCQFIEFADKIGTFSEGRPPWQKAVAYCALSLFPIISCISTSTILGSGLVFVTGALYGMMAIGKKGDRESMLAAARTDDVEMKAQLMENEEQVDLHVPGTPTK
ncbi:hypothetical protein FSP39_017131 [Pinctada imbricata]|uniref:Calcium channel flower n=1 Tax=Pinctada imbricata TaxID=66713 RepID=A0AA89BRE3_PINIB|nr:hypothetical protein FSP39_017131 [Pinctada imbricata]